jgi:two-component system sensor histidine kinase ChvG
VRESAETNRLDEDEARAQDEAERIPRQQGESEASEEGWLARAKYVWLISAGHIFSSLTRRIVILNVAGLVILVVGILHLSQFRAGLIDATVDSLKIQGEIIANAVTNTITESDEGFIDQDRPLELQPGDTLGSPDDNASQYKFSINPVRVARVLHRLVPPTKTRARIYDRGGSIVNDTDEIFEPGQIARLDLPLPGDRKQNNMFVRLWNTVKTWLNRGDLPLYRELGPNEGLEYPEVAQAIAQARPASEVRVDKAGEIIVSVAVPLQGTRAVYGALLLSTRGGEINEAVENERLAIIKVFAIATSVMVLLSVLLAGTIAGPMRRLADSAERVSRRIKARVEIPDFTGRRDEIGHLSGTLRQMTGALYNRIEAIERFAADVAHELKNPLTSLRSAVETLPLAKTPESRNRLLEVIQHDVRRLDRLISDISDASRLDAELQRHEGTPVDLTKLLTTVVTMQNEIPSDDGIKTTLAFEGSDLKSFTVPGHDSRLGQVITNLLDNARSFSPPESTVRVICRRLKDWVEIIVDDDGPGIRPDVLEKIFDRFYTDRPQQHFGQNSGLGLSISKQIVEAHGGKLWAENRHGVAHTEGEPAPVLGARFIVRLPAA